MNYKPDNKCGDREDITFLSEIITNSRYWQDLLKFRGLGIVYCYAAFSNIAAAARLDITVAV